MDLDLRAFIGAFICTVCVAVLVVGLGEWLEEKRK